MNPIPPPDDPVVPFSRVCAFVRQVAHDVRNGLNAIDLESAFISEIATDPEIAEETKKLRVMVGDITKCLQDLSANLSVPALNAIDIKARDFLDAFRPRVEEKFATGAGKLEWQFTVKDEQIEIDFELLTAALFELLRNAFQFAADGSPVIFRALIDGEKVAFEIEEKNTTGTLDPAAWGREPLLSTRRGGYGLGLFRARRVIEAHGGTIEGRRAGDALIMRAELPQFFAAPTR